MSEPESPMPPNPPHIERPVTLADLALTIPCPRCEAKVGQVCRTLKGHPTDLHEGRLDPLITAFNLGSIKPLAQ